MNTIIKLLFVMLVAFGINIILGMWRVRTKKYSLRWFAAIHIAVPIVYVLRVNEHLAYWAIPFLVAFSVFGQLMGGRL